MRFILIINCSTAIFDLVPLSFERFCDSLKPVLGRYPFYVAEHEGKILGYGYAHAAFSKEAYRFCAELTIYFLPGNHHGMAKGLYDVIERALYEQVPLAHFLHNGFECGEHRVSRKTWIRIRRESSFMRTEVWSVAWCVLVSQGAEHGCRRVDRFL